MSVCFVCPSLPSTVWEYWWRSLTNFVKCEQKVVNILVCFYPNCGWEFRFYEAKIEESEKAGSQWESNPGHLACVASALPLSYDNRTTGGTSQVSWFRFPATTGLFTFLYFHLITSKFSLFQHEARVLSTNFTDSWSWFSLLVFITVIVQTLVCCVSLVSVPGSLPRKLRKKKKQQGLVKFIMNVTG